MKIENLVGFQLLDIKNDLIIVAKNNEIYSLKIEEDEGDCCGFNEVETKLLINKNELKNNPIISNVEYKDVSKGEEHSVIITFYGVNKPIAEFSSRSSSGSGWCYGACVMVKCKELNFEQIITEY